MDTTIPRQQQPQNRIDRMLARCARVTSSGGFISEIDGLRFFAIMSVMLFHLNGYIQSKRPELVALAKDDPLNRLFLTGGFGVELFFVISGFILATPFAAHHLNPRQKGVSLTSYYLRRVSRLEPPYFINLFLMVALHIFVFRHYGVHRVLCHLVPSLFYVHNIVYGAPSLINIPAWSLEVEIQFYILAPLIAQLFRIRRRAARLGLLVSLPMTAAGLGHVAGLPVIRMNILGTLAYFITGFVLSDIFIVSWKQRPRKSWSWDVVGTLAWAAIAWGMVAGWTPRTLIMPPLILAAYAGTFRGVWWNRVVRNRWLVTTGGMCYTIYLYHDLLIGLFAKLTLPLTSFTHCYWFIVSLQIAILIPLTVAASALLFLGLEKPFMYRDWPSRWWRMARSAIGGR